MIDSPSHAIELLGGTRAVSDQTKRPLTTVASWAARQSIPIEAWASLIEMAKEKRVSGFTYETLAQVHARQAAKPKSRKAA
ncbi:hypothetical protein UFOVP860_41 [uncultured Caudovirales phage]|uniref:Uncharacterized protein n=1 Tax=uncultured Caudovirales phage TaxID=2100421 RepID=A0A6J5T6E7_9CAUD|nr:hypothetical protein UFOVP860_41 [uncultured Caudovirales phage]CAB4195974.1 hypothetical protein UFOVP1293_70 [uncultured Caudovirales phage]CAB4222631.1 hypothetical protein UFOVP1644_88 [uncultured Caudovirales phage]